MLIEMVQVQSKTVKKYLITCNHCDYSCTLQLNQLNGCLADAAGADLKFLMRYAH